MSRFTNNIESSLPEGFFEAPKLVTRRDNTCVLKNSDGLLRGEQKIGFVMTSPVQTQEVLVAPKQLIIMTSQWSEYADREPQQDRAAAIVSATGIPVLAVDMPGQSPNSGRLTKEQRTALKNGDFSVLGRDLWRVVDTACSLNGMQLKDVDVSLLGMSQGGPIVAGMTEAVPEGVTISDVMLWNSPSINNYSGRGAWGLARDFAAFSVKDLKYYAGQNPEWAYKERPSDMLRIARRLRGHLPLPVAAMARADDTKALFKAITERELKACISIVYASEDRVSPFYDNHAAVDSLGRTNADVQELAQPGEFHAIVNHLGAIAFVAARLLGKMPN